VEKNDAMTMSSASTQPADKGVSGSSYPLVAARELTSLIAAGGDPQGLASYLDAMDGQARIAAVRRLSRRALGELYQHCGSSPPATLAEFLPAAVPVGQTEIFSGLNSLPLFRRFQKRFARTRSGAVIGFNHQTMMLFTGPGYFTVEQADSEILIDYTRVPAQSDVPADWPKVQPNNRGLSHFVYKNMHDFLRRVSADVFIGQATRLGKPIGQYFVLVRGAAG
jgi:hypothetical protein